MTLVTFEIIVEAMLGGSASLDAERYGRALTDNFDTIPWHIIYTMFLIPDWMPYPHRRRAMRSRDFLHRDIRRIVESRRSIQCSQPDLLDLLLTARDHETGRSMSDNEIVTNLLTFIIAGHETTAVALTWTLWLLAKDQTTQQRVVLVLFIISVTITFAVENMGTATGFPFGHYHFEVGGRLPHVGSIPIIVGPLWFGAGYFSWVVASTLLDSADRRLDRPMNVITLPIVAAFVMTQWDLVIDPPESTISKAWIWHDGGADFGVPLSNYLGWLFTSWLFYQAFALYLRHSTVGRLQDTQQSRNGLTHVVPWLAGNSGEVADAAGHVWQIHDLRETTGSGHVIHYILHRHASGVASDERTLLSRALVGVGQNDQTAFRFLRPTDELIRTSR
jgi:putative membrane protein